MSRENGSVRGSKLLVNSGSSAQRWDLVIVGDGFRTEELPLYVREVDHVVEQILSTHPFDVLRNAINVHRVDVTSNESGAGDLLHGVSRKTFFDAAFGAQGLDRLLVADDTLALTTAIAAVPAMNATLMIVNSETYGGSGGAVPVFSRAADAFRIAVHEMGHSHFHLADEYAYYADCADPTRAVYTGAEPVQPNVTSTLHPLKWANRVAATTAIPTLPNPNPNDCTPGPSPVPDGTIGAFEGAQYFRRGKFRPAFRCMMRELADPFCAVCVDTILSVLEPFRPKGGRRRPSRST
ncbi:MAG TPA: M64 family metallopeptidase [Thermoanaerobaculia bacterium]|nr:M64 family metallopeptidase [Thermoanaerobaculia bacterium]